MHHTIVKIHSHNRVDINEIRDNISKIPGVRVSESESDLRGHHFVGEGQNVNPYDIAKMVPRPCVIHYVCIDDSAEGVLFVHVPGSLPFEVKRTISGFCRECGFPRALWNHDLYPVCEGCG